MLNKIKQLQDHVLKFTQKLRKNVMSSLLAILLVSLFFRGPVQENGFFFMQCTQNLFATSHAHITAL
jgi:hypothetical protein